MPMRKRGASWVAVLVAVAALGTACAVDHSSAGDGLTTSARGDAPRAMSGESSRRSLVLFDTTGEFGWLGEPYAVATANLASGYSDPTVLPVAGYEAGMIADHDATFYVGSTHGEPLSEAFLADVRQSSRPVLWLGSNVASLAGAEGSAVHEEFVSRHGWDPIASVRSDAAFEAVAYEGQQLPRYSGEGATPLLVPKVTDASVATVIAEAIASEAGEEPVPWAVRSGTLTYVGEVPLTYIGERDRYLALADLVADSLAPDRPERRRALVRLEDVSPNTDMDQVLEIGRWLHGEGVPFGVGIIPRYLDPNGVNNAGVPEDLRMSESADFVAALRELESLGATLILHGYTHQWEGGPNPYNGISGDDFEFYRSRCSTTRTAPYDFVGEPAQTPCTDDDWVVNLGPLPEDSGDHLRSRVDAGMEEFHRSGLNVPRIFEFPHYAGTVADYLALAQSYPGQFDAVYERRLYPPGALDAVTDPAQQIDYARTFGQFFPYPVTDTYGQRVIPENLGNPTPFATNGHPPRPAEAVVAAAEANLVLGDSMASFFFHPFLGLDELRIIVDGIRGLGYSFVPALSVVQRP